MKDDRLVNLSERWFRFLLWLYPANFRDEMGNSLVEAYRDRARETSRRGGVFAVVGVWLRALADAVRNGPGERARPAASWPRGGRWRRDARLAARRLLRSPGLALTLLGTLTIGLGMFAMVFTVVQKILVEPMPYRDPDDLYFVWRDYGPIFDLKRGWLAGTDVVELQKTGGTIESAVALRQGRATFAIREGADVIETTTAITTPNLFDVLGVQPPLGRGFAANESGPKRPPVVVLTHELWTRLGADLSILGQVVRLNSQPHTVIGVLPRGFEFVVHSSLGPPQRADAYTTFDINLAETNPGGGSFAGLIRARRGTPPATVAAAVNAVGGTIDARDFKSRGLKLWSIGLKRDLVSAVRPALIVVGAAGAFLVLVVMVNLASVLLARTARREHEFAVSRALGANGWAVMRTTLFEGGLLGFTGGTTGLVAAFWGTRMLVALAPLDLPRREAIGVDWRIAAAIMAISTLLGVLAAIAPAAWAARTALPSLLAASAVRGGGGHGRMRRALVVAQVALCLVLLTAGGLVVRSFERLLAADPGFRPEGLLTFRVPMPPQTIPEVADALATQQRIEEALRRIPGVTGVSAANALPLTARASQSTFTIPGAPGNTGNAERDAPLCDFVFARAGYTDVMGIRVIAGRTFDPIRRQGVREALVDRAFASHFFPSGNPIGAQFAFDKETLTIVGVVEQARMYDVHRDGRPQIVLRAEDFNSRTLAYVLRTSADPDGLTPQVRAAVRTIDPRLAVADVRTMSAIVDDALRQQHISAVLIGGFAGGALLLAAMGLFGVVSGSVTRRRHELALRLAFGADHRRVLRQVLGEGAALVGIGVLIGVPGIYIASGLLRGVLVGVSPFDPATLVAVALGLGLVAMIACYVPARRVLTIDPAKSLRQE